MDNIGPLPPPLRLVAPRTLLLAPVAKELSAPDLLVHPQHNRDLLVVLQAAHAACIVHCDLRFANLYLLGDRLVISDWGYAFGVGSTSERFPIGTVALPYSKCCLPSVVTRR